VDGSVGTLPMADRLIDDKTSDTLVAGLRLMVLDEEFDSPPSPPEDELNAPNCRRVFVCTGRADFRAAILPAY
jgi:hypothetical protein